MNRPATSSRGLFLSLSRERQPWSTPSNCGSAVKHWPGGVKRGCSARVSDSTVLAPAPPLPPPPPPLPPPPPPTPNPTRPGAPLPAAPPPGDAPTAHNPPTAHTNAVAPHPATIDEVGSA